MSAAFIRQSARGAFLVLHAAPADPHCALDRALEQSMHGRQPRLADHCNTCNVQTHLLVCPIEERMPTNPLCPEGPRMELPVSLPREIMPKLAEAAAAGPPELPALLRSRSKGLRTTPKAAGR